MGKLRQTTAKIQELLDKVERGEVGGGLKYATERTFYPTKAVLDLNDHKEEEELEITEEQRQYNIETFNMIANGDDSVILIAYGAIFVQYGQSKDGNGELKSCSFSFEIAGEYDTIRLSPNGDCELVLAEVPSLNHTTERVAYLSKVSNPLDKVEETFVLLTNERQYNINTYNKVINGEPVSLLYDGIWFDCLWYGKSTDKETGEGYAEFEHLYDFNGNKRKITIRIYEGGDAIAEVTNVGTKTITIYAPAITDLMQLEDESVITDFYTPEIYAYNQAALAGIDLRDSVIYVKTSFDSEESESESESTGIIAYQGYIPKDWDGKSEVELFPTSLMNSKIGIIPPGLAFGEGEDKPLAVVVDIQTLDMRVLINAIDETDPNKFIVSLSLLMVILIMSGITMTLDGEDLGMMSGIYGSYDDGMIGSGVDGGIVIPFVLSLMHPNTPTGTLYIGSKDYVRWFPVGMTKYQDIADAALCGALIANQKYTIKDYETIVDSEDVRATTFRHFNVVVTAKTRWELEENALATTRQTDEEENVFTPIYGEFRLKFRLNPNKKDFPWITENGYIDIDNTAHPDSIFGTTTRFYKTPLVANLNGESYHIWFEKLEAEHWLGRNIRSLYTKVENPSVGDVAYTLEVDETSFTITNVFVNENPNKGFIYEMEDMYGNQAPWDFYNLEFKNLEQNSWHSTFHDDVLGNLCSIRGEKTEDNVHIVFRNNKIYGHSRNGRVILQPCYYDEVAEDGTTTRNGYLENITINGGNILAKLYRNSTINKGCDNLVIKALSEDATKECAVNVLTGVKGTENDPLALDYDITSYAPLAYIGKASNGDIKIWNPADMINA